MKWWFTGKKRVAENPDQIHPVSKAVDLYKQGKKNEAAKVLRVYLDKEPNDETGWLWLVACEENPTVKKGYLQKILQINPNNEKARDALQKISEMEQPSLEQITANPKAETDEKILKLLEGASAARDQNDHIRAEALIDQAIALDPTVPEAWAMKAFTELPKYLSGKDPMSVGNVTECLNRSIYLEGNGKLCPADICARKSSLELATVGQYFLRVSEVFGKVKDKYRGKDCYIMTHHELFFLLKAYYYCSFCADQKIANMIEQLIPLCVVETLQIAKSVLTDINYKGVMRGIRFDLKLARLDTKPSFVRNQLIESSGLYNF